MSSSKSLLNKATQDDRTPPTGFILQELAVKTKSVEECRIIEELVLKKLNKNRPLVKRKALRVIKYICEHGSPQWRRSWQRHTDKIRAAAQYRGPPDPIYGDSPYADVRAAAKEAMTAVFASTQTDSSSLNKRVVGIEGGGGGSFPKRSTFQSGSIGVISTPSMHTAPSPHNRGGVSNSRIRTEGFGNTDYQPTRQSTSFTPAKQTPAYTNPASFDSGSYSYAQKQLDSRVTRRNAKRKKRQVGGAWADESRSNNNRQRDNSDEDDDEYDDDEFASEDIPRRNERRNVRSSSGSGRRSDGRYEKQWVDTVTSGGGVGIKIHDIDKRVQQFETLSQSHVLEYLDDKLGEDDSWQKQAKALTLIEALLNGKQSETVVEYFDESPENVQELLNSRRSALRKKATKICNIIGIESDNEASTQRSSKTVESSHAQPPPPAQSVNTNDNLLDLTFERNPVSAAQRDDDLMQMLGDNNTNDESAEIADAKDMFGDLQIKESEAAASIATETAQNNHSMPSLLPSEAERVEEAKPVQEDIFADLIEKNDAPLGGANDVISFMSNSANNTQTDTQPPAAGSAFDFMQSGQPVAAPMSQPSAGVAAQPSIPSGFGFVNANVSPNSGVPPQYGYMGAPQMQNPYAMPQQHMAPNAQSAYAAQQYALQQQQQQMMNMQMSVGQIQQMHAMNMGLIGTMGASQLPPTHPTMATSHSGSGIFGGPNTGSFSRPDDPFANVLSQPSTMKSSAQRPVAKTNEKDPFENLSGLIKM